MRGMKARQKLRLGFEEIDELALEVGDFATLELGCGNKTVAHRLQRHTARLHGLQARFA